MLSICSRAVLVNPKNSLVERVPGAEVIRTQQQLHLPTFTVRCLLGI